MLKVVPGSESSEREKVLVENVVVEVEVELLGDKRDEEVD